MSRIRLPALCAIAMAAAAVFPAAAQSQFELSAGASWTRDNEVTPVIAAAGHVDHTQLPTQQRVVEATPACVTTAPTTD